MILTPEEVIKKGILNVHEIQKQQAGIDLTLKSVHIFESAGAVDFDNSKRKRALTKEIPWDDENKIILGPGAYKITLNEHVKIPNNVVGVFFVRTSLIRNGAEVVAGLWDPGFEGTGEMLLVVHNPHGIVLYKNARIGQIMFIEENRQFKPYEGIYKTTKT